MFELFAQMRLDYGADNEEGGGHNNGLRAIHKLMTIIQLPHLKT
jgi:hypothetical protein